MVVVVDDEDRENEGDIIFAAERCTPDMINFLAREARGLVCVAAERSHLERLELYPMTHRNTSRLGTAFTVSVDAVEGTTTGISASDRSVTIQKFVDPRTRATELARPGHVFPLQAVAGGVVLTGGGSLLNGVDVLSEIYPTRGSVTASNRRTTKSRIPTTEMSMPIESV